LYFVQHFSTPGILNVFSLWEHFLCLQALVFPKIILAGRLPAQQNATVKLLELFKFQFVRLLFLWMQLPAGLMSLPIIMALALSYE
jgi:hypothetical protein